VRSAATSDRGKPVLSRRPRPPAELTKLLAHDDRVVSWAPVGAVPTAGTAVDDSGRPGPVVLASRFGLWWPADDGYRLIGWERVDKASWHEGVLTVVEAEIVEDLLLVERAGISVRLGEPRDLPATIRKRVEASVVRSELGAVQGGVARFVARRVPGRDGLSWWARLEPGTPDTQGVRASVQAVVDSLRAATVAELNRP
jgi:hypothetical protein